MSIKRKTVPVCHCDVCGSEAGRSCATCAKHFCNMHATLVEFDLQNGFKLFRYVCDNCMTDKTMRWVMNGKNPNAWEEDCGVREDGYWKKHEDHLRSQGDGRYA